MFYLEMTPRFNGCFSEKEINNYTYKELEDITNFYIDRKTEEIDVLLRSNASYMLAVVRTAHHGKKNAVARLARDLKKSIVKKEKQEMSGEIEKEFDHFFKK